MKLRAIIADDEPLARERLRFLLARDAEVEIATECRNGREVLAALKDPRARVDVLFLDIQMPGRAGFEVIQEMGPAKMPITVFVTAHNHYAVRAFEVHALDYLTKPVEAERLEATLARVRERLASQRALITQEQIKAALAAIGNDQLYSHQVQGEQVQGGQVPRRAYPTRLLIPNGVRDSVVHVADIDWIDAADYYSCLHVGTKNLMLRQTIRQLVDTLDPAKFVRIHRSVIVNVDRVSEICREGRNEGSVVLASGQRLRMSKAGWQSLLAVSHS